jgi:hypothetical protein
MKKTTLLLVAQILTGWLLAQDIIILKNGGEIKAKVIEVLPDTIKYKKWDNQEGPSYFESKANIVMIKYQNGTQDVFNGQSMGASGGGSSTHSGELKQILMSPINGNTANDFLAGTGTLYNKNPGTKQASNFIVIFTNSPGQFEYQSNLVSHVENSIWHTIKLDSVNANALNRDSLITLELIFSPKFRSSKTAGKIHWQVDLETRMQLTKNRHRVKDERLFRGTSAMSGRTEKWEAFQDVAERTEKLINKVLTDYLVAR